jgi:hypothetical protein
VRYQLTNPFVVGQFAIPAATVINLDKAESELTQWEKFAKGHTPPIDALSLDWDCAEVMWRKYPDFRHRLKRHLGPYHEEIFQQLERGELQLLTREQVQLAQNPDYLEEMKKARKAAEKLKRKQPEK